MEYACSTCGMPAGDTTHEGLFVVSGWGSGHDTTTFVWLIPSSDRPAPGILCDACVDAHVAAGRLEAVARHMGEQPSPSLKARRLLFEQGAQDASEAFWRRHGDRPYSAIRPDADLEQCVIEMRREICQDDGPPTKVGHAHATAAIAHGLANADPGFTMASARWARAISRGPVPGSDAEEEELLRSLLEAVDLDQTTGP